MVDQDKLKGRMCDDAISIEPIKSEDDVFITFNENRYYRDGFRGQSRGGDGGQGRED